MRKVLTGIVVKKTGDKTISVQVNREVIHPIYRKRLMRSRKLIVHDEKNKFSVGDTVTIEQCIPISKMKHFTVAKDGAKE